MDFLKEQNLSVYSADINNLSAELFVSKEKEGNDDDESTVIFHTHSYTELFFCISGRIRILTEDGNTYIGATDAAVMPSDYPHVAIIGEGTRFVRLGLILTKHRSKREYDFYSHLSPLFETDRLIVYRGVERIIEEMVRVSNSDFHADSPIPVLRFITAMEELCTSFTPEVAGLTYRKCAVREVEKDRERMLLLEKIISEDYVKPYDAEKIASEMFLSRRHLDRIVIRDYGKTLRELINENRIELAKKILSETTATIDEIGARVGFSSLSSFKKAFFKLAGMTPSEYRRLIKRGEM